MKILSLFDGISCGRVALERAGIPVTNYYASEIDKYAIQVSQKNYPDIIRLGDINEWENWQIEWSSIDLILAGSPCQGFSIAGKQQAFDDKRSALFFRFAEILSHVQSVNPNVKFLLENVCMKKEYQNVITSVVGVEPVLINSSLVSALHRERLYWGNINITIPKDCTIFLKDIIQPESEIDKIFYFTEKSYQNVRKIEDRAKLNGLGYKSGIVEDIDFPTSKFKCLDANYHKGCDGKRSMFRVGNVCRMATPIECERLQTLTDNYTAGISNSQRYKCLGNGWTVDVIAHILKSNRGNIMTTPTLEQFLEDVKNHELTIDKNDGVSRHLKFANPNDCNKSFNITTYPNYLVITGDMGTLVFSRLYDMFDFFRSDNLKINPDYWAEKIQSTSHEAQIASYSKFDLEQAKKSAQEDLNTYLEDNDDLSEEDRALLLEDFECEILHSKNDHEIVEAIRNFNFKGFEFDEFYWDGCRVYTYSYIWLCYAIVWGIKKFDEVSQEIKKEKQAKLKELEEKLAKERLLTRERVKEKQKEELAEIDKAREHAWKEVQIVCGFHEMQFTAGERGAYYGFFLHGWNYAVLHYRKREDFLRVLHHEEVMKLAVSYASLIDERFALGGK